MIVGAGADQDRLAGFISTAEDRIRIPWRGGALSAAQMRTLGSLLGGCSMRVEELDLCERDLGDEGVAALCEGLGRGAKRRLRGASRPDEAPREAVVAPRQERARP